MAYLDFIIGRRPEGKKTDVWKVVCRGMDLGLVFWYSHWRKYTFYAGEKPILDPGCLRELAEFCEQKTKEHKEKKSG